MAKEQYSPLPERAISDTALSALEIRVLAAIAFHDRFSAKRKTAGCWAGNPKLAERCGCRLDSLSAAISVLVRKGYITREPHPINKRLRVFRVIYGADDYRATAQQSEAQDHRATAQVSEKIEMHDETHFETDIAHNDHRAAAQSDAPTLGQSKSQVAESIGQSAVEYIPLKREEILLKQKEISPKGAHSLRSHADLWNDDGSNDGAFLAVIERRLRYGSTLDRATETRIEQITERRDRGDGLYEQAMRILETWGSA